LDRLTLLVYAGTLAPTGKVGACLKGAGARRG
jgi:hypothetical protein